MSDPALPKSIELDAMGQYYAHIISPDHPGQFMLSAYIKKTVDPQILQQAANDIVKRLPFLSGRLDPKFFWYHHKLLPNPPQIVKMGDGYAFTDYYNENEGHVFRVLYGEKHFTLEAIHSVVDGRGLTKVMQALLVRYFELLGLTFNKDGYISCADEFQSEEWEDTYAKFYNPKKEKSGRTRRTVVKAYLQTPKEPTPQHVVLKAYDLAQIKKTASKHNATISEYLIVQIFSAISDERKKTGSNKPITAMVPTDCRAFFPTKSLRNFVDSALITMPETEDFAEMIGNIRSQYAKINAEFTQKNINEFQNLKNKTRLLPRVLKKFFLNSMTYDEEKGMTTAFSNVGKITLPQEIEAELSHMAFIIDSGDEMPATYACASIGNTLTLAITLSMEENEFVRDVFERVGTN